MEKGEVKDGSIKEIPILKPHKPFEFTPARQEAFKRAQAARQALLSEKQQKREELTKRIEAVLQNVGTGPVAPVKSEPIVMVPQNIPRVERAAPILDQPPVPSMSVSTTNPSSSSSLAPPEEQMVMPARDETAMNKKRIAKERLMKEMFGDVFMEDEDDTGDTIYKIMRASSYLKEKARKAKRKLRAEKLAIASSSESSDSDSSEDRHRKHKRRHKRKIAYEERHPYRGIPDGEDDPNSKPRKAYRSIYESYNPQQLDMMSASYNPGRLPKPIQPQRVTQPGPEYQFNYLKTRRTST